MESTQIQGDTHFKLGGRVVLDGEKALYRTLTAAAHHSPGVEGEVSGGEGRRAA